MSRSNLIIRWLGINGLVLALSFLITGILAILFPQTLLDLFGRWANLLSFFGAKSAADLGSAADIFWHIIQRNTLAALIYLLIGLALQAPLAMIFGGAFYGLIAFLAPLTLGRSFNWNDWLLIATEMSMLTLAASLGTAVSGDLYQVSPTLRGWWDYARQSWKRLGFEVPAKWRETISGWTRPLLAGLILLLALELFVAWYETYGY